MNKLFVSEELKKVHIVDEYYIEIPERLSVEVIDKINNAYSSASNGEITQIKATVIVLLAIINSWNFGKELTEENLMKLQFKVLDLIFDKIAENNEDLKHLIDKSKDLIDKKKEDTAS